LFGVYDTPRGIRILNAFSIARFAGSNPHIENHPTQAIWGRWFSDWNYLFGDLMGVNANPEETDELVKDFQDSEAAKEMLDETD
jgi:hypothetical protein